MAALQRTRKLPDLKKLFLSDAGRKRQTWRQQLEIMQTWATKYNAYLAAKRKLSQSSKEK